MEKYDVAVVEYPVKRLVGLKVRTSMQHAAENWDELYFRDYLQEHPDAAQQYEALKLLLQKEYEHNRDAYTKAKSEFIAEHSQKARDEYKGRYVPTLPYKAKDW